MIGRIYPATVATFATSVSVNLGKPYGLVSVEIPSLTSNTTWTLAASSDGTTYRPLTKTINSATLQFAAFTVPSSVTNAIIDVPGGYQYYKIDLANITSAAAAFKFVCYDF